jgi:hypothetical protein
MPQWAQHILVLAIVAAALFVVLRQVVGALRLRHGKIGSCCAKGCDAAKPPKLAGERIVFLPVERLGKKRP